MVLQWPLVWHYYIVGLLKKISDIKKNLQIIIIKNIDISVFIINFEQIRNTTSMFLPINFNKLNFIPNVEQPKAKIPQKLQSPLARCKFRIESQPPCSLQLYPGQCVKNLQFHS